MTKPVVIFFSFLTGFITLSDALLAQNLVPNPSFECGSEDPCAPTYPHTYDNFKDYVCSWFLPNRGTSDIFSLNATKGCWTSMPESGIADNNPPVGFQSPHTGNRFGGIFTYSDVHWWANPSYREYFEVVLGQPLVEGEHYCAEMYVSLAEGPKYASNNIGFLFHKTMINSDWWTGNPWATYGVALKDYTPQVIEHQVILDTLNWVRISGIFKATEPFSYMTIGNFSDDANTTSVEKGGRFPKGASYEYAYYFIDDVSVEQWGPKSFSFFGETTICEGEATLLRASGGLHDITWATLSDTTTILYQGESFSTQPLQTTAYLVKGRNCDGFVKDTVEVQVLQKPRINLGNDTTLCKGNSFTVDAGDGYVQYLWSDHSTSRFMEIDAGGDYVALVENSLGCFESDTLNVFLKDVPVVDLGTDTVVCESKLFSLHAGAGEDIYLWSMGSTDSVFIPASTGTYWVTVSNVCGARTDSIHVESTQHIFVPNVITLNDDNLNSTFRIKGPDGIPTYPELVIFNRWGETIFTDKQYKGTWPGDAGGISSGVYFYIIRYGQCDSLRGFIQVLKN